MIWVKVMMAILLISYCAMMVGVMFVFKNFVIAPKDYENYEGYEPLPKKG